MDELKKIIVDFVGTGKKTKFYFKDIEKNVRQINPDAKMRDIKNACTALINEGVLIYFSTGSSTLYGLKGRGMTKDPE